MAQKSPTIADLKAESERLGLPVDGLTKTALQQQLKDFKKNKNSKSDIPVTGDMFNTSPQVSLVSDRPTVLPEKPLQENEYLFQLDINNLLMYLVSGMFYPLDLESNEIYKTENRRADAQSHYQGHLLLSKGIFGDAEDNQILVRMVLNASEAVSLRHGENFSLLEQPLPVSRLLCVYFSSPTAITRYQASLDSFADIYLDPSLCRLVPDSLQRFPVRFNLLFDVTEPPLAGWKKRLDTYDKLMGMFSFLKNSALFYTNQTREFLDYPASYFECLGLINETFQAQAKNASFFGWIVFPSKMSTEHRSQRYFFQKILEAIYSDVIFSSKWAKYLMKEALTLEFPDAPKIEIEELLTQFTSYETQRIDYKQLLNHPLIKKSIPLTILVFLIRFSNKNITHSDKQAVRHYFAENAGSLDRNTAEYTLAVLGLYYGYTSLPKCEYFKLTDRFFQSLLDNSQTASIKFRLDGMLDRFVIESIYQFTLSGNRINDVFLFLQKAAREFQPVKTEKRPPVPPGFEDKSYTPFESNVRWYIKPAAPPIAEKKGFDMYSTYGASIGFNTSLFHLIMQIRPDLLQVDTLRINRWIAGLEGEKLNEVMDHIELDKKRKKTSK